MQSSIFNKLIVSGLLLAVIPAAQAAEWSGNVSGYLGQKTLDDSDWPDHDEHGSIGLLLDIQRRNWPVSIALDFFGTGDEDKSGGDKHEVYSAETHLGVRKVFELKNTPIAPYISAGAAFVYVEEENSAASPQKQDDSSTGAWVGAGFYARLTDYVQMGVDVRYSEAEVTVFDDDRKAGGLHAGVTAGYHW